MTTAGAGMGGGAGTDGGSRTDTGDGAGTNDSSGSGARTGGSGGRRASMEYQSRGKKRAEPSIEAQREPSSAHSDARTPVDNSTSGQQNAQISSMVSNQRSHTSPTGDTSRPFWEKATTVSYQ
ncbi:GPI-anchored hemophore cfmA-like [Nymphaea colorata]|uniref:GPI-anchored hemophore cfmA-like n=1 Tax=Nymphaea colorata TaxID=210225 RepID=UPI00129E6E9A|nr:GPI-anchored hemophore cfmA-like [Nymphaea colorata]